MVGPERAVAGGTARDLTRWLFPRDRPETILYLGGINLMLLQYVTVREFVAILSGYEVVIGLVFTAFFLGYSFGYLLSGRLDRGRLRRLALATFLLHTLLPFLPRVLVGFLFSRDLPSLALMGVLFLGTFAMASFYS
ncbi:MAG: hypothetical protein ACE5HU_09155, partial [Acidobacteriota bacterium]